jgi:type IV pilus assembly protein PilW
MNSAPLCAQRGVTLIELLVGLAIGLMTIAVALSALMVSRGISVTVSDASQMQQQASYALRVIGLQLRQAGSIRLNLAYAVPTATASAPQVFNAADPVAFDSAFDRDTGALGAVNSMPLSIGYQNYTEQVNAGAAAQSLLFDCQGRQPSGAVVQSNFQLVRAVGATTGDLQCTNADGTVQTVIGNVADLQVVYLLQTAPASGGAVTVRRVDAATAATAWPSVVAVEVCFELVGETPMDSAGGTFVNCGGATTALGDRLHMVFRNTFQLRTQGGAR